MDILEEVINRLEVIESEAATPAERDKALSQIEAMVDTFVAHMAATREAFIASL